jgi:hypothetical protein
LVLEGFGINVTGDEIMRVFFSSFKKKNQNWQFSGSEI